MLGSIEDLEKDIEKFQQNMAASSEMQLLLQQMLEQIKQQNLEFGTQSSALISRVENLPSTIENANITSNNRVKADVNTEMEKVLQGFANEQSKYLQGLEQTKQMLQNSMSQISSQEKAYSEGVTATLTKFDDSTKKIVEDNSTANASLEKNIDKILEERNAFFSEEQKKYIEELHQTSSKIKTCEEQLTAKYSEFMDTLQKMNISNLYEQNIQLKKELSKRTTILMIISAISVVVGIVGLFI